MKDIFDDMPFNHFTNYPDGGHHEQHDDFLSKNEHEELRLLLAGAKAAFAEEGDNDLTPDPQIHKNLRAMVAAHKKSVKSAWIPDINVSRVLNFKVPVYQVGFAMMIVFFVAVILGRNVGLNGNKNTMVVFKTDTVFEKMQEKAGATSISKDSQAEIFAPSYSGGLLYTDSFGINGIENNNDAAQQNQEVPGELKTNPGFINSLPGGRKVQSPGLIDTPNKGSSLIEDSSKWNRQMRG